ncbi:tetratricopeptide repeat protein [Dysgonomonas capnocytophagoides]|uniref:tetratricopeptide repeat protein n=1 Tax=Dysgonomonas capnocytophagoides TaxID=45254 RepID=UPI00334168C6
MNILERNFKKKVVDDLKILNGEEFEIFCKYILQIIIDGEVIHKGHNLYAKPVGYTADFANPKYSIIGQSGTDEGYFDKLQKPLNDVKNAIKNHPKAKKIILFSNQYAGTSRLGNLISIIESNGITSEIDPYDSERIANVIADNIIASHIIDKIFEYLPSSYELYKILPKTSQVPAHRDIYYNRNEEIDILNQLSYMSIVQIYGISGVGKTEISIKIAQRKFKDFDTIIWIEGDSIQNSTIDFTAIKISKFDKLINLSTILESYKVFLIFDNINLNTNEVKNLFKKYNLKNSECIITSLSKSLDENITYNLKETSDEIAFKILFNGEMFDNVSVAAEILKYTGRHPLILRIIRTAVENGIFDWKSLIKEIKDINQLTDDDRNQTISNRIIGKINKTIQRELSAIKFINNRLICKVFLESLIGQIGISKLKNNSIISLDNNKYYSLHQIILDSIKEEIVITDDQRLLFYEKIKIYLQETNKTKDIGFYCTILNHRNLLDILFNTVNDKEFKRIILYSIIQGIDIKSLHKNDDIFNYVESLILENKTYYENLLSIELGEIKLLQINKRKNKDKYDFEVENEINKLTNLLNTASSLEHKLTLLHHLGKLYIKKGNSDKALDFFEKVLKLKPRDPFALLQIARIYKNSKDINNVEKICNLIFSEKSCPLSVLLSFYELISYSDFDTLKFKYIDENIDRFTSQIIEALDSKYDQPYSIIAKLSRHLAYNFSEYFEIIINNLPTPSNLDFNEDLRFNYALILSSYCKYIKEKEDDKMSKALSLAKGILSNMEYESDYKRGIYVDILLASNEFDNAIQQMSLFETKNEFYFQKLSKAFFGNKNYLDAIEAANKAIDYHKSKEGTVNLGFLSAFYNDLSEAQHAENDKSSLDSLETAIELQPNDKTKSDWLLKLDIWRKNNSITK